MNVVVLAGNLCFDPELRYTASGQGVCGFRLAVNRNKDKADFIDVTVFDGTRSEGQGLASRCAEWLQKGSKVVVNGSWQVENWEDKDGNRRTNHKCIANRVDFMANTKPREEQQGYTPQVPIGQVQSVDPDDIPF